MNFVMCIPPEVLNRKREKKSRQEFLGGHEIRSEFQVEAAACVKHEKGEVWTVTLVFSGTFRL